MRYGDVWVLEYRRVNKWSRLGWKYRGDEEVYENIDNMMIDDVNIHIIMGE